MRDEGMSSNDFRALVPSGNLPVTEYVQEEEPEVEEFKPITSQEELDEIVGKAVKEEFEERRRKYRERKRKEKEEANKRSFRKFLAFLAIAAIIISVQIITSVYPVVIYNFADKQIYRNLSVAEKQIENVPETMPEMAWDSNLPKFMRSDMENALDWGWTIKYKFHSHTISIERGESRYVEGEVFWILRVDDSESYYSSLEFEKLEQLSVFEDANGLYFYAFDKYDELLKLSLTDEDVKVQCVSRYPKNIPLIESYAEAWDFGDVTLVKDSDSQEFTFWSDGFSEGSTTFEDGAIYKIPIGYSLVTTTDNKIYSAYAYKLWDDSSYHLEFRYIGQVDDVTEIYSDWFYDDGCLTFEFPMEEKYRFPIVKKDGEYYTCLPEDIKDYCSYSLKNKGGLNYLRKDANLNMRLVKLSEIFVSAKIYYTYTSNYNVEDYSWVADAVFEYDGIKYTCKECPIYGYDRAVNLDGWEEEILTQEVRSIDEYWEAVELIRSAYEEHYDKPVTD